MAVHRCEECESCFQTRQQLSVHEFRKHGKRPELRAYVHAETCLACLFRFSHRPALHNHVFNRSKPCKAWYQVHATMVDADTIEAEIEEDRQWKAENIKKGTAKYGVTRLCGQLVGPLPFGAMTRHEFRPKRLFSFLETEWLDA